MSVVFRATDDNTTQTDESRRRLGRPTPVTRMPHLCQDFVTIRVRVRKRNTARTDFARDNAK